MLTALVARILSQLRIKLDDSFIEYKSASMLDQLVSLFNSEISRKTGRPEKPAKTGFQDYASNRAFIELCARKLIDNLNKPIPLSEQIIGDLGDKGRISLHTDVKIQTGSFTDGDYAPVRKINKNPMKEAARAFNLILHHVYSNALFEKIATLNKIENVSQICSINDLLLFHRHFRVNGSRYNPSTGESRDCQTRTDGRTRSRILGDSGGYPDHTIFCEPLGV